MNAISTLNCRVVWFACLVGCHHFLFSAIAQADDRTATRHTFVSRLVGDSTLEIVGTKQVIHADTQLRTSIDRRPAELDVVVHAIQVQVKNDNEALMDLFVDRQRWSDRFTNTEFTRENAPEFVLQQLASFDTALCTLSVDQDGRERARILAGATRQADLLTNQIDNILFFQVPFYSDQSEWRAKRQISISQSGVVTGELTYKKRDHPANNDYVTVDVSGELTNPSHRQANSPATMKNTKYVVKGEQTYNVRTKLWERGGVKFDVSFLLAMEGQPDGAAKGTMSYTFEPAKVVER